MNPTRKTTILLLIGVVVVFMAVPIVSFASHGCTGDSALDAKNNAGPPPHDCLPIGKNIATNINELIGVINRVVAGLQLVLFAAAALFIVIAAITYLTAGGEEEKIGKAKNMIIYAIIAIVLALLAFGLDDIVKSVVCKPGECP